MSNSGPSAHSQNCTTPPVARLLCQSLNSGEPTFDPGYLGTLGFTEPAVGSDSIGLETTYGITIARNQSFTVDNVELVGPAASAWLQEARDVRSSGQVWLKIFWAEQIIENDSLRPTESGCSVILRKTEIAESLGVQAVAIEKMGTNTPWEMNMPAQLSFPSSFSYHGLAGHYMSVTWSFDVATLTTYAFVVVRRCKTRHEFKFFMQHLEEIKHLCRLPLFMPYVIASTEVALVSEKLAYFEREAVENNRGLSRLLYNRDPFSAFVAANGTLATLSNLQRYTPSVIRLARQETLRIANGPAPTALAATTNTPQSGHQNFPRGAIPLLIDALEFRAQELESLSLGASSLRGRITNHISSILGLISFHQQTASQEIATATRKDGQMMKEIAEATKKDSSSMKILSVMAALYLPATTVATVMSMPVFDWDAERQGSIVNQRFWVYFVFTIPLTLLTMLAFWFWADMEKSGSKPKIQVSLWIERLKQQILFLYNRFNRKWPQRPGEVA